MLTADYAMKQLQIGAKHLDGFRSIADFATAANKMDGGGWRFWINPAPLRDGDVTVSAAKGRTFYGVRTTPVVFTEPYDFSLLAQRTAPEVEGLSAAPCRGGFDR